MSAYAQGIVTRRCIRCDKVAEMGRYKFLPVGWGEIRFGTGMGWSLCGDCLRWFKAHSPHMQERIAAEEVRMGSEEST